jgi:Trk-type K+ transport system membrane component
MMVKLKSGGYGDVCLDCRRKVFGKYLQKRDMVSNVLMFTGGLGFIVGLVGICWINISEFGCFPADVTRREHWDWQFSNPIFRLYAIVLFVGLIAFYLGNYLEKNVSRLARNRLNSLDIKY